MDFQRFDLSMRKPSTLRVFVPPKLAQDEEDEWQTSLPSPPPPTPYTGAARRDAAFDAQRFDPFLGMAAQNAVPHYTTPTAPEFAIPPPRALPAPGAFAFPPVDERAEHVHDLLFNWQFYDREEGRDSASSSDEDDIKSKDATKVLARVHCSDDTTTDDDDDARGRTVSRTRVRAPRRREFSRSLARPNRLLLCAGAGPSDESSDEECFDCGLGAPPTTRRPSVAVASATQMSSPVAEKDVTERLKRLARALVGVRGDRE